MWENSYCVSHISIDFDQVSVLNAKIMGSIPPSYPSIMNLPVHDFCHSGCGLQFSYVHEVHTCFLHVYKLLDVYV